MVEEEIKKIITQKIGKHKYRHMHYLDMLDRCRDNATIDEYVAAYCMRHLTDKEFQFVYNLIK